MIVISDLNGKIYEMKGHECKKIHISCEKWDQIKPPSPKGDKKSDKNIFPNIIYIFKIKLTLMPGFSGFHERKPCN